jgi:hypothetical protein
MHRAEPSSRALRLARALSVLLLAHQHASAADFHALPGGAGRRDGSGWENALDARAAAALVKSSLKPGDRLRLGSGTYRGVEFEIGVSGEKDRPIVIEGIDTGGGLPVIEAQWDERNPERGATAIDLGEGARHLVVQRLRIRNHVIGVNAPRVKRGAGRVSLQFLDVDMERVRHGFYLSDCDELRIEDCDVRRYTKHGFRLDAGCDGVTLRRCSADCTAGDAAWERLTELLPFGFFANGDASQNTQLLFEDCLARNNLMPLQQNAYKNGDGFVVEERNTGVRFVRCRSLRNQDGGFDLKARDVRLAGCVALGNGRNFRIWTTGTLENCFSGRAPTGLWLHGGPVALNRCTFFALTRAAIEPEDADAGPVVSKNCLFARVNRTFSSEGKRGMRMDASNVTDDSARFKDPADAWEGDSDAMNCVSHPGKGWRFPVAELSIEK